MGVTLDLTTTGGTRVAVSAGGRINDSVPPYVTTMGLPINIQEALTLPQVQLTRGALNCYGRVVEEGWEVC